MLAAMRDEQMIHIGDDAELGEPFSHHAAMKGKSLMREIAEKRLQRAIGRDFFQNGRNQFVFAGGWRHVEREIDGRCCWAAIGALCVVAPPLHECPAADFSRNEAARFSFRVGARNRPDT